MSERNQKVLSLLVDSFEKKHGRKPMSIVVAPVALVALGVKRSVSPSWEGVGVVCRLFVAGEVAKKGDAATSLGVFLKEKRGVCTIVGCDLKS